MTEKVYVTQEGLEELKQELEHLVHVVRQEVIEELKAARAQGDLSENADYDAAKDRQAQVESRIAQLEAMLKNIEIIEETSGGKLVRLGSTVRIQDLSTDETFVYTIVGTVESDPLNGKLSNTTPLAVAIIDKKVGAVVEVQVDEPYKVKVLEINVK